MSFCSKCGAGLIGLSSDFCPVCGVALFSPDEAGSRFRTEGGIPWESVHSAGFIRAITLTLWECLFSPNSFFVKLAPRHNASMAFIFALVIGAVGSILGFLWTALIGAQTPGIFPWIHGFLGETAQTSAAGLILAPILITMKIGIETAYLHMLLALTGSKRQGLKYTFSVVCYGESAAAFNLVPVIGGAISVIWSLYILTIGISRVHRLSAPKAILIIVLPLLFLGIVGILAVSLIAGLAAILNGSL